MRKRFIWIVHFVYTVKQSNSPSVLKTRSKHSTSTHLWDCVRPDETFGLLRRRSSTQTLRDHLRKVVRSMSLSRHLVYVVWFPDWWVSKTSLMMTCPMSDDRCVSASNVLDRWRRRQGFDEGRYILWTFIFLSRQSYPNEVLRCLVAPFIHSPFSTAQCRHFGAAQSVSGYPRTASSPLHVTHWTYLHCSGSACTTSSETGWIQESNPVQLSVSAYSSIFNKVFEMAKC